MYLAIQKATKRRVAIKVMHGGPFAGSAGRARFEREVQILGQLNHPNIVAIHDSGVTGDGSCFYVMDYISGRTLDAFIRTDSRPPIGETLRLFQRICEAVNAAHLRGVIHRDLKPANIRVDPSGEPVVVDFGLAKIAVPDVTAETLPQLMSMTGQFIGSLPWASPEQAQGSPGGIDVRTDVYSLGVILYQLLTGRFPYEVVGNMRDVLDNILRAEPARPSTIRRQINDEVETIILRCLAKEKERRYQSAGDRARDIERYLAGEPIEAKSASGWYVLGKTIRKHRLSVGVVAAAVIGIAVFAVVMSVLYGQVSRARKDTVAALSREQQASAMAVAERDRAQSNLELVRRLARASVNEFDEGIANLRGATPVRLRLIEVAQASLAELLPRRATTRRCCRRSRRRTTGWATCRGLFLPKVGDIAAATALRRGLRLREQVLSARPSEAQPRRPGREPRAAGRRAAPVGPVRRRRERARPRRRGVRACDPDGGG